jgi:hypothetical protein
MPKGYIHGMFGTPTYKSWENMHRRCKYSYDKSFKNYGGRGIKVAPEWSSFINFFDDMGFRPDGLTLDRLDVNGDYCKDNCRWASSKTQSRNTRSNVYLTYKGETKTIADWAEALKLQPGGLYARIRRGVQDPQIILFGAPTTAQVVFSYITHEWVSRKSLSLQIGTTTETVRCATLDLLAEGLVEAEYRRLTPHTKWHGLMVRRLVI